MLARPDLAAVYDRRLAAYAGVATLTVATDDRHPEAISADILSNLAAERAEVRAPVPPGA